MLLKIAKQKNWNLQIGQPWRETDLTNASSVAKDGRGRQGNAKRGRWEGVLKIEILLLKIARGVLKIETPIFERIGPPQAQLAAPIASRNLNLTTFFQEGLPVAAGANVMRKDPTVAAAMPQNGPGSVWHLPRCHQFGDMKNQIFAKNSNICC